MTSTSRSFELKDGPGVQSGERRTQDAARGDPADRLDEHLRLATSTWSAGARRRPPGLILGHEITGEVIETGPDVEFIKDGDLCSVPFNIACGRCRNCKEGHTGVCLNVNPDRPGSAYGYVDMGGWVGGQAEYVMVPYADWNLLKFPDKEQAMEKMLDLTMLSDIFPTGFHGASAPASGPGSTVYVAGAGPVGLAAASLGAAARRRRRDRRRPDPRAARAGALVRLRDDRHLEGRPEGADRADPRRARGRLRQSTRSASRPTATARTRRRRRRRRCSTASWSHPRRRQARHPGPLRDRGPGRRRRRRQGRLAVDPDRSRMGEVALVRHRSDAR